MWVWNGNMDLFKTFNEVYQLRPEYKKKLLSDEITSIKEQIEHYEEWLVTRRKRVKELEKELNAL